MALEYGEFLKSPCGDPTPDAESALPQGGARQDIFKNRMVSLVFTHHLKPLQQLLLKGNNLQELEICFILEND